MTRECDSIGVLDMFLRDMHDLDYQLTPKSKVNYGTEAETSIKSVNSRESAKIDQVNARKSSNASKKTKAKYWLKRKEELNMLRHQTQELKSQMAILKLDQERHRIQLAHSPDTCAATKRWKAAAMLEKSKQQMAQHENYALKSKVQRYAQLLSNFQSKVMKASLQTQLSKSASPSMYRALMESPETRHKVNHNGFNTLEARLDQRFQDFPNDFLELYQILGAVDTKSFQVSNSYGAEASVMEYKWSGVLPFDETTTSNTVWGIVEGLESPQKTISRVVRRSEDKCAVDSRYVLSTPNDAVTVDSQCVVKRFMIPGRFIILAESSSEYRGVSGTWSSSTQESVWFAIRHIPLGDDNHVGIHASGCQMKAVVHSKSDQQYAVQDVMRDSVRTLIDSQRQLLENVLWDAVRTGN